MSKNVFANGNEVSCKKDDNKSIAAMADTCLSPPSPPAGPVPLPYPNTAEAVDTTDGTKTVKIGGDEVGMKNSSSYKKSTGDEAATKTLGMGVVTHTIQGKMKHAAWSFDVKFEGANAIRHMDLTTHNHINQPNIAATLNLGGINVAVTRPLSCRELEQQNEAIRAGGPNSDLRPSAADTPITVTTASFSNPPGQPSGHSFMRAVSRNDLIRSQNQGTFAASRDAAQTLPCSDEEWGSSGLNNHTEPKLMGQVFEAVGDPVSPTGAPAGSRGSMTMNIYHRDSSGSPDNLPCPRCECGICAAQACGLDIIICGSGRPECVDGRIEAYTRVRRPAPLNEWVPP